MERFEFNFYAAYHIIRFADDGELPEGSEDAVCDITDDDLSHRMQVAPGIIVMYTARAKKVPLAVELLDSEPEPVVVGWDHVVEGSLDVTTGTIVISVLNGGFKSIETSPGWYRARAYQGKLASVKDPDGEGDDHYLVRFWLAPEEELLVLKQYAHPA